jgi:hypothetical protein
MKSIAELISNLDPKARMPRGFNLWSLKMQRAWLSQNQIGQKSKPKTPPPLTSILPIVGRLTPSEQRLLLRSWRAVQVMIYCDSSLVGLPHQTQADVKLYRHWHNVYSAKHGPGEAGLLALCLMVFQIVRGRPPLS